MEIKLEDGPITITKITLNEQRVEFVQTLTTGSQQESVAVSVVIPVVSTQTIQEIHQAATDRAAQLLQMQYAQTRFRDG